MHFHKKSPKKEEPKVEKPTVIVEDLEPTSATVTTSSTSSESITLTADLSRKEDPNVLHEQLLKDNNLQLDFDVLEGTISTKYGIIKLDKPTLVVKATYVASK